MGQVGASMRGGADESEPGDDACPAEGHHWKQTPPLRGRPTRSQESTLAAWVRTPRQNGCSSSHDAAWMGHSRAGVQGLMLCDDQRLVLGGQWSG